MFTCWWVVTTPIQALVKVGIVVHNTYCLAGPGHETKGMVNIRIKAMANADSEIGCIQPHPAKQRI